MNEKVTSRVLLKASVRSELKNKNKQTQTKQHSLNSKPEFCKPLFETYDDASHVTEHKLCGKGVHFTKRGL